MAVTIVQENVADVFNSSVASVGVTLTGVAAGNLIAVFIKQEGVATTTTVSDGTTQLTPATKQGNPSLTSWGQWFYLLAAAGGTITLTASFSPSTDFPVIFAYEVQGLGGAWSFDAQATANGTGTAMSAGNMTVAGPDGIGFGGFAEFDGVTVSAAKINGVAADRTDIDLGGPSTTAWARVHTAGFTGAATGTINTSVEWACCGIAFKAAAGGGGGGAMFPPFNPQPNLVRF